MARRRRKRGGRRNVRSTYSSLAGLSGRASFDVWGTEPKTPWLAIGAGAIAAYYLLTPAQGSVAGLGFWKLPTSLKAGVVKAVGQVRPITPSFGRVPWWARLGSR